MAKVMLVRLDADQDESISSESAFGLNLLGRFQ